MVMLAIQSLPAFILASALLSLAPGPDNIFVLTQSALYGKTSGILITLGLCTGLIVHTSAVAFGVAVIFQTSAIAFTLLKIAGALYLLYLAWLAFRSPVGFEPAGSSTVKSAGALYRRGILMNLGNPKVSIFFLAFLPQFADPDVGQMAPQIFILGGLFMLVALIIFCSIALLAGQLGNWLQQSVRARSMLNRIAGTVLALLALRLAFSASASS